MTDKEVEVSSERSKEGKMVGIMKTVRMTKMMKSGDDAYYDEFLMQLSIRIATMRCEIWTERK